MRVRVPFPVRSRSSAYGDMPDEDVRAVIRKAPTHNVPLSIIRALQHTVDSDRLAQYESDPSTKSSGGSPIVVMRNGKAYLRNGHHRATAALRRGDHALPARVAHLGPSAPIRFRERGHAGELLMIDPGAMSVTYRQREVQDVAELVGNVAVVCIEGPLESKPDGSWWSYFDDYESILCRFRNAIESDEVKAVLLKFDSPGGSVAGLNECVFAMQRAKKATGKPVIAYSDEACYSAAYALACAADEIYLPRSGGVASIGVISQLVDWTKANEKAGIRVEVFTSGARKADFNPNVPISGGAMARVQARVDELAKQYWKLVKQSRGISAEKLEADTFYGKEAVKLGLADGVMSLDGLLETLTEALDNGTISGTRSQSHSRQNATESNHMSKILALTAAVKVATVKLSKASSGERSVAEAKLAMAESALARELSKMVKDKKVVTTTHESESASGSSGSSMSSSSSSASGSESKSESASESESESASESEAAGSAESESAGAILAAARKITGKRGTREVLGALMAMGDTAVAGPKAAKALAKLTAERQSRKVDDLIASGKAAHKITPGNEAKARKIAARHGSKALAAFIDAAMPAIDGVDVQEAEIIEGGAPISQEQRKIWTKFGYVEADFPKLAQAMQKDAERAAKGLAPKRGEIG